MEVVGSEGVNKVSPKTLNGAAGIMRGGLAINDHG